MAAVIRSASPSSRDKSDPDNCFGAVDSMKVRSDSPPKRLFDLCVRVQVGSRSVFLPSMLWFALEISSRQCKGYLNLSAQKKLFLKLLCYCFGPIVWDLSVCSLRKVLWMFRFASCAKSRSKLSSKGDSPSFRPKLPFGPQNWTMICGTDRVQGSWAKLFGHNFLIAVTSLS